jgi:hypothetical protein
VEVVVNIDQFTFCGVGVHDGGGCEAVLSPFR